MLDLLVGILHLVVFPGGLFALALGLFLKGCDRRVEARLQRRVVHSFPTRRSSDLGRASCRERV